MSFTCIVCDKYFEEKPRFSCENGPVCSDKCFHINYWNQVLDDDAIIINGRCYHSTDGPDRLGFRGMGGQRHKIQFNDGRILKTTSLWVNGGIPEEFHREDNAKFLPYCEDDWK